MTTTNPLRQPPGDKLRFLAETVLAEADLLRVTDGRLFAAPMDTQRAGSLRQDVELSERVDAFVARFGRLQDTIGDKLLPLVLAWVAEPVGPAIDNLMRAERLGWIVPAADWMESRQLRNFMIHEYVRDMALLASALTKGHRAVPLLIASATTLADLVLSACTPGNHSG